jgi:hypothetical protein
VEYLLSYQITDGAWNFMGETAEDSGDTNTTALVLQALIAAGNEEGTQPALDYFRRIQNEDGGWPYQNPSDFGTETDANSTALVLQALYAAGETVDAWQIGASDPLGALLALQNDNGSFSYQASFPGDNALATIQAVPSIAGATLAQIVSVKTSAMPGAAASPPPTTMPEAGGAGLNNFGAAVTIVVGLLLIAGGLWLKQARQQTSH